MDPASEKQVMSKKSNKKSEKPRTRGETLHPQGRRFRSQFWFDNPNDPNIHKELASVYAAQGRADDAFCELMAALLIDRRDAGAHSAIGQLYLDSGRDAEAVVAFDRALELMPGYYETRYALATTHTRLGHTAEAARQLDLFERARLEALEQSRRDFASEAEREERSRPR